MEKRNLRVMVASEYPEMRQMLGELVRRESGGVVVAEANNGIRATDLARTLRPDVAVVDFCLPYRVGLDDVPLSRIGGLDAAQTISQDIPHVKVVVLNNLEAPSFTHRRPAASVALLAGITGVAHTQMSLQELVYQNPRPGSLIFAGVEVKERGLARQRVAEASDKVVMAGGLTILAGLGLMLTILLAGAGALLAIAGAAILILGLAGKAAAAWWPGLAPGARRKFERSTNGLAEDAPVRR